MTFATFLRDSPCEAFRTLYSRVGGGAGSWSLRWTCGKLPHPVAPGSAGA